MINRIILLPLATVAAILIAGCGADDGDKAKLAFENKTGEATDPHAGHDHASTPTETGAAAGYDRVAGLGWPVPKGWAPGAKRQMRVVTYMAPMSEGDPEDGECAVFYFGPDQGGAVDANVDRWLKQFEQPDGRASVEVATTDEIDVSGIKTTTVEVGGTYTAGMAPRTGAGTRKQDFYLLAAILEGPEGAVFFKFTGPRQTVLDGRATFDKLIRSVRRDS